MAAVTAALVQLSRLLTRGARAGVVLATSYRRASTLHAGPRWRHGRTRGQRRQDGDRGRGERGQGSTDTVVGRVAVVVDNKDEDDSGGRRHQATTNPMMVIGDDGGGGRQ